jgi:hypothetical protein
VAFFDDLVAQCNDEQLTTFGDSMVYTPSVGSQFTFAGIVDINERAQLIEAGSAGTAWALLTSFPSPPKSGDTLTFAGVDYRVSFDPTRKLDGSGGAIPANDGVTLVLRRI